MATGSKTLTGTGSFVMALERLGLEAMSSKPISGQAPACVARSDFGGLGLMGDFSRGAVSGTNPIMVDPAESLQRLGLGAAPSKPSSFRTPGGGARSDFGGLGLMGDISRALGLLGSSL